MLWTAFTLGLLGSLHCMGMCGPIALSLPAKGSLWKILPGRLLYQSGRIMGYSLLGAVAGLLGLGAGLAGLQQGISITLGIVLILGILLASNWESRLIRLPGLDKVFNKLYRQMRKLLQAASTPQMFQLGILNGFLPCGFVYLGLAGALNMESYGQSVSYMALFGLGTLPLMLVMSLAGGIVGPYLKRSWRPFLRIVSFFFAVYLIIRGLDLGIPYLSPELSISTVESSCH
ncbi:MAG: sulfite exporter TauE/SafE family protein [Bacteroidota bacterium]